ncbi:hypothetical protein C0J52_26735 [Blattella germanica]|nr:hypothetical protein C0J52_26735 [Blattella germanica]
MLHLQIIIPPPVITIIISKTSKENPWIICTSSYKFVVFAKRVDVLEARLRVFCMTDDKEDKTLEHQEHFTEVAKSRDVEVLEGKSQYIEFAGNLVPVTKSGDQLQLGFRAFRENRLPFTVRVKDPHADTVGRILFMREPKVAKGEPPQQPICILNIVLPETILPESTLSEPDLLVLHKKYSFLRDGGLGRFDTTYQRTDLRLSDISNLLGEDWVPLASELGITTSDVNLVKSECPSSVAQQAMAMLRLWLQQAGNKATGLIEVNDIWLFTLLGNVLETALRKIGRDDIVQQCIFNVDEMDRAVAKVQLDQSGFESLKEELGPSRDASLRRDASLDITYDEQDIMKESESVEELVQAEKKEPYEDRLSKPAAAKDRQEGDIEETKYIGEEKVVEEEERKTVAQLKEIFAQDKRDRQYERQPQVSEQLPVMPPVKSKKERVSPPSISEDISKVSTTTEDSIHATIEEVSQVSKTTIEDVTSTIEEDISKKQPSPQPSIRTEADQRRDSELFQGVTEELVRLETTYKVIPAKEELMSPKVSKTPPPSPAEFRETTGNKSFLIFRVLMMFFALLLLHVYTEQSFVVDTAICMCTTTWQQGDVVTTTEQESPAQGRMTVSIIWCAFAL